MAVYIFVLRNYKGSTTRCRVASPVAIHEVKSVPSSNIPRSASKYADVFTRSAVYERMMQDLHGPVHPSLTEDKEKHIDPIPEFHQNFWDSTMGAVRRLITLTLRDTAFLIGRSVMVILMGLLYSSTFYQFEETNAQLVMGIIFNAVMFVSLGQQAQMPMFMAARAGFYKQRRANFFRTSSFVLSNSVSRIPLGFAESLVRSVLAVRADALFGKLGDGSWFLFLSCASPNLNVANPVSMVSILFFVLFAGFIPDYLIWIYWINPIAWGIGLFQQPSTATPDSIRVCTMALITASTTT
ncbi:ABC transporter [Phytophthora megakarya]|uniref:ABC transporter n=1 Tax=Phytophthora megakarya TaxID=4795 RepID=A0A225UV18_9STRA|nr:ABC transporter [Phytophthora megakarya]